MWVLFSDDCQMTVMGRIILRFFYKVWIFGAVYFGLSWFFLLVNNFRYLDKKYILIVHLDLFTQFGNQSHS